jgi:SH3-like domain-containing protein
MAIIRYLSDRRRIVRAIVMALALFAAIVSFSGRVCAAERLAISVATANIRSGPGTQGFDILWEVEKYYPIEVVQRQGEWIFFKDFEADEGWIHKDLVDKTDTVITINDMINVRAAPGTENPIAFKAERGVPLRVLERRGDWLQIESAQGDKGWVHRTLVW